MIGPPCNLTPYARLPFGVYTVEDEWVYCRVGMSGNMRISRIMQHRLVPRIDRRVRFYAGCQVWHGVCMVKRQQGGGMEEERTSEPMVRLEVVQRELENLDRMMYDHPERVTTHRTLVLGILARLDAAITNIRES